MINHDDAAQNPPTDGNPTFGSADLADYRFSAEDDSPQPRMELKVTGLHCPSCGSPIMDGEVACSYCSTGFLYELVSEGQRVKFKIPPNAEQLNRDKLFGDTVKKLATEMLELVKDTRRVVYVMVNSIPLIMTADTLPKDAVEQYRRLRTHIERAKLGVLWTDALMKYKSLVEKIVLLTPLQREEIVLKIEAKKDQLFRYAEQIELFFARPNLDLAMTIADEVLLGNGDDEVLKSFVDLFTQYVDETLQKK